MVLAPVGLAAGSPTSFRHVRPLSPGIGDLLLRGYAVSPTFRALIGVLERSDVIVHVEQVNAQGNGLAGATRFITRAGDTRYVRITAVRNVASRAADRAPRP